MASKQSVIAIMTMLEEVYPHRGEVSDATILIYCDLFEDIPDDLIAAAAKQHVAQAKFFPSPAELLEIARKIANWEGQSPPAILAWGEVQECLTSGLCAFGKAFIAHKPTPDEDENMKLAFEFIEHKKNCAVCRGEQPPEFSHPLITKTVEAMGWRELRISDNHIADRAHFMKAYEAMKCRDQEGEVMLSEVKQLADNMSMKRIES